MRPEKILRLALATTLSMVACGVSAGSKVSLDEANIDPNDHQSLQRGVSYFVDYCFNCHSLAYSRYNRIARDIGMPESELASEVLYTGSKIGDTMTIALQKGDAKSFFGTAPPDLTVVARARGVDWIYTYLRSFYRDESRPWGVNNLVFKDVAMPHVLWELQGLQQADKETIRTDTGKEHIAITGLSLIEKGKLSPAEFDDAVRDIVNFLHYVGEPAKADRLNLGRWVLAFLAVSLVVMILLKKEYWRDVKKD